MRRAILLLLAFLSMVPAVAAADPCAGRDPARTVAGGNLCLAMRAFGAAAAVGGTLVVVLHGDASSGGPAVYHFDIAREIAAAHPAAAVAALVRPGYSDGDGLTSDGDLNGRRDHYTPENVDAVAAAVAALRARTQAARVLGIGHSGGAATFGVIAGRRPGTLDAALLLSCPCDIPAWRAMNRGQLWPRSLSPHDFFAAIPAGMKVALAVGAGDSNTWPRLSENYVNALKARGLPARLMPIDGVGHNLNSGMRAAVLKLLAEGWPD
ncbi:MAG: hypothetical protein JNL71_17470 [Rhodospirillales bacterium]|nr:hypothetical protein [Rhodospirillales bacterium]